jgi:hypothetical protein
MRQSTICPSLSSLILCQIDREVLGHQGRRGPHQDALAFQRPAQHRVLPDPRLSLDSHWESMEQIVLHFRSRRHYWFHRLCACGTCARSNRQALSPFLRRLWPCPAWRHSALLAASTDQCGYDLRACSSGTHVTGIFNQVGNLADPLATVTILEPPHYDSINTVLGLADCVLSGSRDFRFNSRCADHVAQG